MKSTTKSSSGIFKMVPQFLQSSTDRLHVDPGGSLPTLSWMIWHHTGFCSLFSLFLVPSGVGATGWSVFLFFCDFRTRRVGRLECAYLISHLIVAYLISNFSSRFCNIDCLTLHANWWRQTWRNWRKSAKDRDWKERKNCACEKTFYLVISFILFFSNDVKELQRHIECWKYSVQSP